LAEFGDSSLNFELAVWLTPEATKRPSAVRAAYNWALETSLARHGLEIPFPQRDLHIRSAFGLDSQAARTAFALKQVSEEAATAAPAQASSGATASTNDALEDVQREIEEERESQPREEAAKDKVE
jgi:small-conductance mechanosensitive channel